MACGICLVLNEVKDEPITQSEGGWWCRKHLIMNVIPPGGTEEGLIQTARNWKGKWGDSSLVV
jgi:hypothetical protein